jgi:hypothetical protein
MKMFLQRNFRKNASVFCVFFAFREDEKKGFLFKPTLETFEYLADASLGRGVPRMLSHQDEASLQG